MKQDDAGKLRNAIQNFMERRDLNVHAWSVKAGLSEGTLRNFLKGRSDTLSHATLAALARAAEVSIAVLIGEMPLDESDIVEVREIVRAGSVENDNWLPVEERMRFYLPEDNRFHFIFNRHAAIVSDESANLIYPKNTILVYIDFEYFERMPVSGEKFIVKLRPDSHMTVIDGASDTFNPREVSVREYVERDGKKWLTLRSTLPEFQDAVEISHMKLQPGLSFYGMTVDNRFFTLEGIVVASYRLEYVSAS